MIHITNIREFPFSTLPHPPAPQKDTQAPKSQNKITVHTMVIAHNKSWATPFVLIYVYNISTW